MTRSDDPRQAKNSHSLTETSSNDQAHGLSYSEIVAHIERRGIMPDTAPSLKPTEIGLERIGFYQTDFYKSLKENPSKVILVAGTNGKGSVCATLETLFMDAGESVGLYISPHLMDTRERIRYNRMDISQNHFCLAFEYVEQKTQDLKLTHFETLTLMAVHTFTSDAFQKPVDRLILEVGLGGLWDATNAVPHGVCVFTNLGLDHTQILGPTLLDIAKNKFGIIQDRFSKPLQIFHQKFPQEISQFVKDKKTDQPQHFWTESLPFDHDILIQDGEPQWLIRTPWGSQPLVLPGYRGIQNTSLALNVFRGLGFDVGKHLKSLKNVRWPGRMEKLCYGKYSHIYLSGDHNPDGVSSLIEILQHFKFNKLHVLMGVTASKDFEPMIDQILAIPGVDLYLTVSPFHGRDLSDFGSYLGRVKDSWPDCIEAFKNVLKRSDPSDMILVTGSLYLVGKIRQIITNG